MMIEAMPSAIVLSKTSAIAMPMSATKRPASAAISSSTTVNSAGSFDARSAANGVTGPRRLLNSRTAL